jgi:hypothetical protein
MLGASYANIPDVIDTRKVYNSHSPDVPKCIAKQPDLSALLTSFVFPNAQEYIGGASQYACALDITFGMKYGLLKIGDHIPRSAMDGGMKSFVDYIQRPSTQNCMSHFDGGQLAFNFLLGEHKTLMWSAHLGGYDGVLNGIEPKPDVLIQAIAGRANLNGRPYDGSSAAFAVEVSQWLGEPERVIWCLHDDAPIKPWTVDAGPATRLIEEQTRSKAVPLELGKARVLF